MAYAICSKTFCQFKMYSLGFVLINLFLFTNVNGAPRFNVIAFYDGTFDAAHINFVHEAIKWFPKAAGEHNFAFTSTKDWGQLNENNLKKYQVVMFLDGVPHDNNQRKAFQNYMEHGGGWMGFHVAAFSTNPNEWSWYHNTFLGKGAFKSNTWWPTKATLKTENHNHVGTKGLPDKWTSCVNEWYAWTNDLRKNPDINILASIDPSSFPLGTDPNQSWYSGYYPVIWSHKKYKMVYCNFGHNLMDYAKNQGKSSTFESQTQNKFVLDSLEWLAGVKN